MQESYILVRRNFPIYVYWSVYFIPFWNSFRSESLTLSQKYEFEITHQEIEPILPAWNFTALSLSLTFVFYPPQYLSCFGCISLSRALAPYNDSRYESALSHFLSHSFFLSFSASASVSFFSSSTLPLHYEMEVHLKAERGELGIDRSNPFLSSGHSSPDVLLNHKVMHIFAFSWIVKYWRCAYVLHVCVPHCIYQSIY